MALAPPGVAMLTSMTGGHLADATLYPPRNRQRAAHSGGLNCAGSIVAGKGGFSTDIRVLAQIASDHAVQANNT
jgi:hypothetical protein